MRSLAVLLVSIGVLGVVGPRSAASAASAGSGTEIYSAAVNGSDLSELTSSAGSDVWPAPSPDGARIAFVQEGPGPDDLLDVIRSDGSGGMQLWSATPQPGATYASLGPPVWSPDGKTLLVSEASWGDPRTPSGSLELVPLDGGAARAIGPGWNAPVAGAFSPDGRYVAYQMATTWFSQGRETVGVIAPGGRWRSFGRGTLATWSPRADRLAFIARRSGFLTVVAPDGHHRWTLAKRVAGAFAWSPTGKRIALVLNERGAPTLFLARPGSDVLRRVVTLPATPSNRSSYGVSWSADGRWLAAAGDGITLLVRPDGTGLQAIIGVPAPWTPTGHTLAYVEPNGSGTTLNTWPARLSIDQAPASDGYEGIAWSVDGTRLIFAREASTSSGN
jgi:Tol biopolymer transport system component